MQNNLRRLMAAKGITARDLAAKAGVAAATIYRVISGANTSIYMAQQIASVLGCTLDDIFCAAVGDGQ